MKSLTYYTTNTYMINDKIINMLKEFLINTFFPQFCLGCGKEGDLICEDCLNSIEILEYQFCPFCKVPRRVLGKRKCALHRKMNLEGLFAATSYKDPLVKLKKKKIKYEPYLKTLAEPLAFLIISHFLLTEKESIFRKTSRDCVFVPIPLHPSKKRRRGFNQSTEIAYWLSLYFKVPLLINNLIKVKKTQPQVELKEKLRKENIKGAFKVKNPQELYGKKVFLVDDVFTTGATLEEAAKVLKEKGAKEVWGVVVAREPI